MANGLRDLAFEIERVALPINVVNASNRNVQQGEEVKTIVCEQSVPQPVAILFVVGLRKDEVSREPTHVQPVLQQVSAQAGRAADAGVEHLESRAEALLLVSKVLAPVGAGVVPQ